VRKAQQLSPPALRRMRRILDLPSDTPECENSR
jgi:hypothetical protein